MKNINKLSNRMKTDSKSRELAGNPRLYRYPCATLALPLRYVAMIFAVLVMSVANIGMAWGTDQTYTISTPTAARNVSGNVLITGTVSSKTVKGTSSTACFFVASGSYAPVTIASKSANIKSITIKGNRDTGSSDNTVKAFNVLTSSDLATFTTPASGFTATKTNNGSSSSVASLSDIPMVGNNQSYVTEVTISFDSPVMGIELTYSNSTSFSYISVTYDDAITAPSVLCEAHATSTTAYGGTGCTVTTDGVQEGVTISSTYYYNKLSGDAKYIKLDLGSGKSFAVGDEIWIECNGNGIRTEGAKLNSSASATGATAAVSTPTIASSMPMWVRCVTVAASPWKAQQSLYVLRNSSNSRIYQVEVRRAAAAKAYTVTAATSTGTDTYGTVSASASSLDKDETTTITATPATGYQVTNWAVSGTGASISPSGASNSNTTTLTMGTANATVTATFGPKSYTVTLDNQSATTDGTENVTTTYNSNTNLTSAITKPTKTGYVFAGYFTATNGGGVQLIDAAGNWIASAGGGSTYMDGSKNWKYDNSLTLYACWMEYCPGMDMAAQAISLGSGENKIWTGLTTNKILYSVAGNTTFDDSSDASNAYDGLKFKNSGDYILFLVQANSSLKLYFGYTDTKPKISINGGAESTVDVGSTGSKTPNQEVDFGTQTYDRLIKLRTVTSNTVVLQKIEITAPAGCSGYSFHWGIKDEDGWEQDCFEYSGSDDVHWVNSFTIPAAEDATHFYVGKFGSFYETGGLGNNNAKSYTNPWTYMPFTTSQGDGSGTRPMVGQAEGATGKIRIADNSTWDNLFVSFLPDGYKLKFGSTEKAFAVEAGNEYRSELVEYNSSTADDAVSVGIIDSEGGYVSTDNTQEMRHLFLNTGGTSLWSADGRVNFGIYSVTSSSWVCLMAKVPGEDYLYEGWVPTTCETVNFARLNASTLSWDNRDNQTENITLASDKNLYTITGWADNAYSVSAYTKKGKFRMNADYTDKNWYVRFYPYNVLTYDANGGSGAPDTESVPIDGTSSERTVEVAAGSGMTAPTGYQFAGWNPDKSSADAGTKDGNYDPEDDVTLSADVTLYAVWSPIEYTITLAKGDHGAANQSAKVNYDATALTTITHVSPNTGYQLDGYYDGSTKVLNADGTFADDDVTGYITSGKWSKADNCTLTAKWSLRSYTLTWDLDGGTVTVAGTGAAVDATGTPSSSVTYTSAITAPTVTKDGYQFTGWSPSVGGTMPAANTTYTAQWALLYAVAKGTYTNGSMTISPTSAIAGATVTLTATPSTGYEFDAWTIKKTSDGSNVTASVSLSGQTATATFTMPAYGVTVDAAFEESVTTYSVTYAAGVTLTSGDTPDDVTDLNNGDKVTVAGNTGSMVYTGYTFRGWTDGTTFYQAGDKITISGSDVDLTAVWDSGSGSCTEYELLISSASLTREGSTTPKGDYITGVGMIMKNADGSSNPNTIGDAESACHGSAKQLPTSNSGQVSLITYNAINKVTIYGLPTGKDRTVSTIKTATNPSSFSSDIKSTCTLTEDLNTSKTCGETTIEFPSTLAANTYIDIQLNGNVNVTGILFENCAKSNFTVSFADGNTAPASHLTWPDDIEGVPTGKKILAPSTTPTATNYKFGGWYTDAACTSAFSFSGTITKDTTLYAKWTEKSTPAGTTLTPTASSVCSGSSTTLTLNASTSGVEYELYEGETKLRTVTGTGSALSLGSTSDLTEETTYTVKTVENDDYKGMTLDVEATVSIATATSVSVASTSLAATVGEAFTIDGITASGTGDLSHQWYSYSSSGGAGEDDIDGATSSTYTFTPDEAGSYYFKCAVTGDCGTVKSDMITVTATDLFDITMGTHTNGSFTIKVGSADAVSTSTASSAGATIAIVATPGSGYVFKNWEILDSSSDDITTTVGATATSASTSFTMPSEAVKINAVFVATHSLTVSVSGGVGGSVSPTSTTVGETLTQSITATPSTGYNFSSWAVSGTGASLSSTTTNPTTFTMGTANATVTATFSAKTYGITLDAGNGTGGSGSVTMTYNSSSHTAITAPTLTGYSLVGWYTGAGGTGAMVMNASGVLQASVDGYTGAGGIWTKDATCTLYAKYAAVYPEGYLYITDVMATPEAKAGYTITMTKNSANYNGTLGSTLQTNRAGYEYWADATGSSGNITLSFSDALPASATAGGLIIDVWWGADSNNRTTSIALNGGSAELLDAANTSTGDRDIVKKATYATELKSLSSITLSCSGGHTVWFRIGIKDRPGYLLTYEDGDGSGAPSAEYKPNATITLSSTAPTRSGYIFDGWQVGGSGTVYQPGDEFSMPASAVTLVAKWTAIDFEFKAGTTKGSEPTDGTVITSSNLSTYWTAGAVLTGGTMTNTSGATLGINASYGFVYAANGNRQLTINLTGSKALGAGTIITVYGYSNNSTDACGFKISGNNMSPATYTPASAANTAFTQTYTVTEGSALDGETSFTVDPANNIRVYLNRIIITGCQSCTPIDPELTAGTTTLYLEPTITSTTLTLDKDGSTGSVDWSVSPSGVVSITGSGTEVTITAVAAGSATVKATIGSDGTHCGKTVTKDFTVATCEIMEIAGATVASATSGILTGTTAIVTGLSSNKLNTSGTSMFGLILPSSANHFQVGDSILFNLKVGDWYQGAKVSSMCVYVSAGKAASKLNIYTSASIASGTSTTIRFAVTQAMIDAGLVDSVIVFRDATTTQNHVMSSVSVKRYACSDGLAKFTGDGADANWNNEDNWAGGKIATIDDRVIVKKPATVNVAHAQAAEVILYQHSDNTGKLTIEPNKGLEVVGTVKVYNGSDYAATTVNDLVLESSTSGNASLIFDNSNADKATVQMYSIGDIDGDTWNWQFMGTPFTSANALYSYYGSYLYEWKAGGYWDAVANGGTMTPFTGYCITQDDPTYYVMDGTLNPTTSKTLTVPAGVEMVFANSWSAPIDIGTFTDEAFGIDTKTVYLFNTGFAPNKGDAKEGTAAGTYVVVPIHSSPYTGNELIAPMQGFYVDNTSGSAGSITMDYSTVVRPTRDRNIVAGPMRAPERVAAENEPAVMKIKATGSRYSERIVILEREDFSTGFDNGWDGKNLNEPGVAPILYALRADGTKDAVSAIPAYEGTVVGFRQGEDNAYTFSFEYDGEDIWYLNDLKEQTSTLIDAAHTYTFSTESNDTEARFIISATPIQQVPTGFESSAVSGQSEVRKVLINDHIYIIRSGRMYSVDGAIVK